jgi:Na+/proline symporter
MVVGFVVTVGWVLFVKAQFYELYEMIPGVAAGLAVTVGVSLFTTPPAQAGAEFDSVKKAVGPALRRRPPAAQTRGDGAEKKAVVTDKSKVN